MMYPTRNLFARAAQRQTLTPAERALLRLVEGLACTALVAALPILAQALAAAAVAVLLALVKYAKAFGDPPLDGAGEGTQSGAASEPGRNDLAVGAAR
jgi:hypothetical protein